jgi:5-methylcytosine-specific restriction endonuclease McrA
MKRAFAEVPFSRANVYARDDHRCQYCSRRYSPSQLTFDHVLPVARGGHKGWDNIVTCCTVCNRRKGDRTPEEAGLQLVRRPRRPESLPSLTLTLGLKRAPESWRDYIAWNIGWDQA